MASASGAGLYRGASSLPYFENVTDTYIATGSQGDTYNATGSVVVDADHDGYEDILLTRARDGSGTIHDVLLRNDHDEGTGVPQFTVDARWPITRLDCAVWADRDQDGYWDVFGCDGNGYRYFSENAEGFQDVTLLVGIEIFQPIAARWTDIDHQNSLDLVVATEDQGVFVLYGSDIAGRLFDSHEIVDYPENWNPDGIATLDYDLDGWTDLVLSGADDQSPPLLMINLAGAAMFNEHFVDGAGPAGLAMGAMEASAGVAPADYDGDFDTDLVIARSAAPTEGGRLYQNAERSGSSTEENWIAFDFESNGDFLGNSFMGTVISIYEYSPTSGLGTELGRHVLDGGHGRGGQESGLVIMGLGDYDGQVEYRLHMTNVSGTGTASAGTIVDVPSLDRSGVLDLTQPVTVDPTSVNCKIEVDPATGLLTWRFSWMTNTWSPTDNDVVRLDGNRCSFLSVDLDSSDPDVETSVRYYVDPATGERSYVHEVAWVDQPCSVGCSYTYTVESSTEGASAVTSSASGASGRIKICPQSI
jgi:hypothetical protein